MDEEILESFLTFIQRCNSEAVNSNDYNIARTIINHIEDIKILSLEKIAEEANISPASVSRFINKAGFESFQAFKYEFELFTRDVKMRRIISHTQRFMRTTIHYKENAGEMFQKELDIVCADMRSSSYEAALTRFEARLNSPQLSDVVRGLIGVLRGDDGAVYFQMLTHDFKQAELQRLKAKAAKIPPKIRVFSFAMLLCFLATYFAIIGYEIIKSMGTLF